MGYGERGSSGTDDISSSESKLEACCTSGWLATSKGRKELRITNEEPRQVTPITTRIDPRKKILGTIRRKSIEDIAPVKPNPRSSFFR